jgi:hypothetical protein
VPSTDPPLQWTRIHKVAYYCCRRLPCTDSRRSTRGWPALDIDIFLFVIRSTRGSQRTVESRMWSFLRRIFPPDDCAAPRLIHKLTVSALVVRPVEDHPCSTPTPIHQDPTTAAPPCIRQIETTGAACPARSVPAAMPFDTAVSTVCNRSGDVQQRESLHGARHVAVTQAVAASGDVQPVSTRVPRTGQQLSSRFRLQVCSPQSNPCSPTAPPARTHPGDGAEARSPPGTDAQQGEAYSPGAEGSKVPDRRCRRAPARPTSLSGNLRRRHAES